ncbi:MAG: aldo/keto reductase [Nocardioides sp.]|uniref:aldo/keto reductase n=1 Tax=Nocardioides sp. TaxID=35761 RepID=UPI0039E3D533
MDYILLGRSGLKVSEVALGGMTFGLAWGNQGVDAAEATEVIRAFAEAGGNFLDTANTYTEGESEEIIGDAIAHERDRWVVASKFSGSRGVLADRGFRAHVNSGGNSRKAMLTEVESSLRRLKTDRIDVFYVHFWDFTTSPEEVMRGLDDLVRAGKILYPAFSDTPAWVVSQANTLADLRGWAPAVALQVEYSLLERSPERELFPMAAAHDLAIVPWRILAGGRLAGPGTANLSSDVAAPDERELAIIRELQTVAAERGLTPAEVANAWVRSRRHWAPVIPVVGARTAAQLRTNLGALSIGLDQAHLDRLTRVSDIPLGFPMQMITSPDIRALTTGGMAARVRSHRPGSPF